MFFDVGNTCGQYHRIFCGEQLKGSVRMSTDVVRTGDQYAADLYNLIKLEGFDFEAFDGAIAASVVPAVTWLLNRRSKGAGAVFYIVGPGSQTGLNIK